MKKLKPREWILILVPCIFALGAWQSGTDSWLRKSIREASRQELYVESVETLTITPRDVQRGFDGRLRVVFNCTGWRRPYWWANAKYGFTSTTDAPSDLVIRRNGKVVVLPFSKKHVAPTIGGYDRERDRYTSEYNLNLATLPRMSSDVELHARLWITDWPTQKEVASNKVLVTHVVLAANTVVRTPIVSRESGLRVTHAYLSRNSIADAKGGAQDFSLVAQVHYKGGTVIPENARHYAEEIQLLDQKNRTLADLGQRNFPTSFTMDGNAIQKFGGYDLEMSGFDLPKILPRRLTLRRVLSLPGLWPIEYSTVIHDPDKGLDLRRIKRRPSDTGYTVKPTKDDVSLPVNQKPLAPDAPRSSVLAPEKYRVR